MTDLTKILLLCVDAAESELIAAWSRQGHLPTWQALLRRGLVTRVENSVGLYTGSVWPSFQSGLGPGRHGRYYLKQIESGSYQITGINANTSRRRTFWDALGQAGRRVAIIDVPKSPLSSHPKVTQIADWGTHDPEPDGLVTCPPTLAADIVGRFGHNPVDSCDRLHSAGEMHALRDGLIERVARKEEIIAHLLERGGWDLLVGAFCESHCAGHQFWHLHDPAHPKHDPDLAAELGDPLLDVYRAIDTALGRLLEKVGRDVPVLVYTSHGMGPHYDGTFLLDEVLRRLENAPDRSLRPLQRSMAWFRRAIPWRWLLPSRLRRAGRSLADVVEDASEVPDRQGRTCFQVPTNDNCAGIRVNLKGREPQGRIAPGAEYDALCDSLAADLKDLINLETGRSAVRAVHRSDRLFQGEFCKDLPDLLVQWHRHATFTGLASPKVGEIKGSYHGVRTGDHRPTGGLLVAQGPGIEPGERADPIVNVDIAPTLAAAFGVTLDDIEGQPMPELAGLLAEETSGLSRR